MTLVDDLVADQQVFVDASPDGSLENLLRAQGAMFAQMDDYASDADEVAGPDFFVNVPNLVPNPSFEYDGLGAAPAGCSSITALPTFVVNSTYAKKGLRSLHIVTSALGTGGFAQFQFIGPSLVPSGAAFFYPVSPGQFIGLRGSLKTNTVTGTFTVGFLVQWYDVAGNLLSTSQPTPGAVPSAGNAVDFAAITTAAPLLATYAAVMVVLTATAAGTLDANVDAFGMFMDPAGVVPPPNDGDDPGWDWAGIPGNSTSALTTPLPQVGYSKMMDVDRADTAALGYLGQWVGERMAQGASDASMRKQIRSNPNAFRGTLSAIADGIFPLLTGSKSVFTRTRSKLDGTVDANWLAIQTYASETPNSTLVQQTLRQKLVPANILLDYQTLAVNTWSTIETGAPTWATVESGPKTWVQIQTSLGFPTGYTLWTP